MLPRKPLPQQRDAQAEDGQPQPGTDENSGGEGPGRQDHRRSRLARMGSRSRCSRGVDSHADEVGKTLAFREPPDSRPIQAGAGEQSPSRLTVFFQPRDDPNKVVPGRISPRVCLQSSAPSAVRQAGRQTLLSGAARWPQRGHFRTETIAPSLTRLSRGNWQSGQGNSGTAGPSAISRDAC